jgi:hypothetical protein
LHLPNSGQNTGLRFSDGGHVRGIKPAQKTPTFFTTPLQEKLMAKTVADVMKMVKENEVR